MGTKQRMKNNWYIYGKLVLGNPFAGITLCYTCGDIIYRGRLEIINYVLIMIFQL